MGKTKREPAREDSFHKHYAAIWGEQRWQESLYPALARPTRHAALINQALPPKAFQAAAGTAGISHEDLAPVPLPTLGGDTPQSELRDVCFARKLIADGATDQGPVKNPPFPQPQMSEHPSTKAYLITHWNLDAASVLAVRLLDVRSGEKVLDLCAAPGGKSIALAQDLFFRRDQGSLSNDGSLRNAKDSQLCSNEADKTRFRRLAENIKAYLTSSLNVTCTNIDAISPNAHRDLAIAGGWDKILVDAPCSSERHIIHAHLKAQASGRVAPEMANWRPGSTRRLQEIQIKLLMTALRLLKDDGSVLYATCSIEPGENDGVVEKVRAQVGKERKKGVIRWDVRVESCYSLEAEEKGSQMHALLEKDWAERTTHGWIVLPDHASGGRWGPLFFTKLVKVPAGG